MDVHEAINWIESKVDIFEESTKDLSERTFRFDDFTIFYTPDHTKLHIEYYMDTIKFTNRLLMVSDEDRKIREVESGICVLDFDEYSYKYQLDLSSG